VASSRNTRSASRGGPRWLTPGGRPSMAQSSWRSRGSASDAQHVRPVEKRAAVRAAFGRVLVHPKKRRVHCRTRPRAPRAPGRSAAPPPERSRRAPRQLDGVAVARRPPENRARACRRRPTQVHHEFVVSRTRSRSVRRDPAVPTRGCLSTTFFISPGAKELPLFDVQGFSRPGRRDDEVRSVAEERRDLESRRGRCAAGALDLGDLVDVREHRTAERGIAPFLRMRRPSVRPGPR